MVKHFLLASLVAVTACTFPEQPLPPGQRQVVVHAVLDPSLRYQTIDLSTTDGSETNRGDLDDAAVSITTPDGRQLFARRDTVRDSTGKVLEVLPDYRIDLQAAGVTLVAGGTYSLLVIDRLGERISGETTIPSAAAAPLPALTQFERLRDTLRMTWERVPGARTFEVQVWVRRVFNNGSYTFATADLRQATFADTSVTFAGTAKTWDDNDLFPVNDNPYETLSVRVSVYAVDENYYEYYRTLGDPYIGAAPSRLKGGLGVFGSVVPVAQRQLAVK